MPWTVHLKDWVPAASLATLTQNSQEADETFLTDAVSSVAREVFGCMCNSIPSVKSFSPSSIEVGAQELGFSSVQVNLENKFWP